jgi:hypothetical protein
MSVPLYLMQPLRLNKEIKHEAGWDVTLASIQSLNPWGYVP